MPSIPIRDDRARRGWRLLVLAAALPAAIGLAGCASSPKLGAGPAEVSVTKSTPAPVTGGVRDLAPFDLDTTPGANALEWGTTLTDVWLPQAEGVMPGLGTSTAETGSVYLSVPAEYEVTAAALIAHRPAGAPDAPAAAQDTGEVTRSQDPVGTVVTSTVNGHVYLVSASPDAEGRPGFSTVLVQWSPVPAPTPIQVPAPSASTSPTLSPNPGPAPVPGAAPDAAPTAGPAGASGAAATGTAGSGTTGPGTRP